MEVVLDEGEESFQSRESSLSEGYCSVSKAQSTSGDNPSEPPSISGRQTFASSTKHSANISRHRRHPNRDCSRAEQSQNESDTLGSRYQKNISHRHFFKDFADDFDETCLS